MALFIIRDLTHWSTWDDFLLIWKHKYYLPEGGNFFVVCNSTGVIGSVVFNGFKWVVVYVAWTLQLFFHGVTHEWMSYIFEVLLLFWLVVISLLSSWYEIYVCVELITDDVWEAEYYRTGFLSVGVNSFDRLFLKNDQFSCPWYKMVLKNKNMINKDKWKSSTNRKMRFFLD